jgi:hypothetical protein
VKCRTERCRKKGSRQRKQKDRSRDKDKKCRNGKSGKEQKWTTENVVKIQT